MHAKQILQNLISTKVRFDEDSERKWKIVLISLIGMVAIANLFPLGIFALMNKQLTLGIADILLGVSFAIGLILLKRGIKYDIIACFNVYLTGAFFLYLFAAGGFEQTGHLWLYPFPLVAVFLLGLRAGIATSMVLLSMTFAYAVFSPPIPGWANYSTSFCTRFFPSLLAVTLFASIFEYLRKRYYQQAMFRNAELKTTIHELSRSEISLKQAQTELENRLEELRQTKKAAEAASKSKSEFLANMSHELRTPLNHIIGFTELVVDHNFGPLTEEQTEYLGDVLHSSRHLLSLINDILDLSKIDAGKLELNISDIRLSLLLENSMVMIKEKALKHGIRLETDINGIPDTIWADERKLKQIIYNLLSNAVKFTLDGGQIRLMARGLPSPESDPAGTAGAGAIEISVADTGIGIAAEDLERVFAPFEQVQSSTTRQYQGTGLGLSLSRQLVELQGGRIWAQSKGKGCGTTFSFTLPLQARNVQQSEKMSAGG